YHGHHTKNRCASHCRLFCSALMFTPSRCLIISRLTDVQAIWPAVAPAPSNDNQPSAKTVTCLPALSPSATTMSPINDNVPDIEKLFERDGYLRMHEQEIRRRYREFSNILNGIEKAEGK